MKKSLRISLGALLLLSISVFPALKADAFGPYGFDLTHTASTCTTPNEDAQNGGDITINLNQATYTAGQTAVITAQLSTGSYPTSGATRTMWFRLRDPQGNIFYNNTLSAGASASNSGTFTTGAISLSGAYTMEFGVTLNYTQGPCQEAFSSGQQSFSAFTVAAACAEPNGPYNHAWCQARGYDYSTNTCNGYCASCGAGTTWNGSSCVSNPSPTITVSVSPASISSGGSFNVNMSSTNATSCVWSRTNSANYGAGWSNASVGATSLTTTGSGWAGPGWATYSFTCSNSVGSASGSGTVNIAAPAAVPTVNIYFQ